MDPRHTCNVSGVWVATGTESGETISETFLLFEDEQGGLVGTVGAQLPPAEVIFDMEGSTADGVSLSVRQRFRADLAAGKVGDQETVCLWDATIATGAGGQLELRDGR